MLSKVDGVGRTDEVEKRILNAVGKKTAQQARS